MAQETVEDSKLFFFTRPLAAAGIGDTGGNECGGAQKQVEMLETGRAWRARVAGQVWLTWQTVNFDTDSSGFECLLPGAFRTVNCCC